MDESIQEQIEHLKFLRSAHDGYVKHTRKAFDKLHEELRQALTDKITELEAPDLQ